MATDSNIGGIHIEWLLAAPVREYVSKTDGQTRVIIELRDPANLGNSLTLFLDGAAGTLTALPVRTIVKLHVHGVRSGKGRGELSGDVSREAVEAAFRDAAQPAAVKAEPRGRD